MSDTGGGSAASPTPGMSDSEGVGGGGRTTSASGLSRTSGTSRTSLAAPAPTTTISTIAVQSGNTRIVIALLQSAEWLELRVVELTPGMVYLGANLEEATQLLHAHEEVLAKLQNKQSPVEDLLNQADQLISTQHPRAEVYASMAESLGLAWKDLNSQLETRKQILDMGVSFHTRAQQYSDSMDAAERAYTDNVMPNDAEGARQLLSSLHDHKRSVLEASMYTLQEAQALLARLRGLSSEGATLDSRPLQIKTNIEFACSQIEHYLESLHDRRRFLDGLFSARKHHLEQCLALCLLYQDLTEAVTALKQLRDEVSQHQGLGESQSDAEFLYHEHIKREIAAKEQQDKCIRLLKTAETMASKGHYAGLEARSRAYSVLEAATALHETCDTRTALLQQTILFFKLAQTALTKLDQAEVQVASLGGEGAQRLSLVLGVVEEAVQPALTEGYAILEVTGGRSQPHNMGISLVVEELERRRSHLSSVCVSSTEQVLQRTELSNAFLEQYNTIESWLVRIGDAFLQGHQDPGGSLSLAKDFLHLHQTLNHDVMEKKNEIEALSTFLEKLLPDLSAEEGVGYQEKIRALQDHWIALKKLIDLRIGITKKYVKFHEDAEAVNNEHEALELLLKEAKGEDRGAEVEAKWEQVQKLYLDLCNTGKAFCQDVKGAEDPYLDSNRAILCVESILEHLGKRRLVITDLHSHFHMKITMTKEMLILWKTYRENVNKMHFEMSQMETDFCPLLRGDTTDPEGMANTLVQRLNVYVSAVKKTQEDIQNMMTKAEVMSYKGDEGGQRDEVIGSLLQLYQNLQNKATEYQILGHMLIQWCRNIAEIHRSCDKLESQFSNVSLDIGGVEGQLREHEASKQAVLELLKFAQNEANSIVSKIRDQCPPEAGAQDIAVINELLKRRGTEFEKGWLYHQHLLERQLRRSQYHVDLQVISDQLRDLSEQLSRMRGHYGDSLAAATNMQTAFNHFQLTVDMLEKRIQTFVTTTTKMLGPEDDSGEVQEDLAELEKKWSTFQMQVGQSKKSIELSIVFYKLVEEAEDWVKQGGELLVDIAGDSSNIQTPEQAEKLRTRIENFLKPEEEAQQQRITKLSSLALQLYGGEPPRQIEVVNHQNTQMIDSFTVINRNLIMLVENLRSAEDHRERQKKEKEEMAASLAAAQAEAGAARLATIAAEEARKAAEEVAIAMAVPIEPIVPEKVEIEIQTEAIPLPDEEPSRQEDTPPLKKAKLIDDEPQPMPPVFLTPLVGATVTEGVKFTFECKVLGMPMPEVEWLKDNMSITANPDYKTSYEEGICTLTIEETFTEDSALFTCKAVNGAGMAETSATLIVKEAEPVEVLAPPSFTKRLVDSTAQEGATYQLEATVEGHPLPVVSWAKDGNCIDESPDYVITFNNGECVLRFEEVFLEDKAEYSCKATNDLGEDITKAKLAVTAVEVSERPKFTMPLSNVMARAGQKFKLECHVTGLPSPTVTWFHNSKPVKETPDCRIAFDGRVATLVMSEAFPKNAGTYTVVAKNSAGEGQCSANVSVKGRIPTETSDSEVTSDIDVEPVKPSVQLPLKDTNVMEGKSARLDCVIVGQPEPEVIWYHDDKPVKESSDFKLLFHGDRCSLIIQEAFLEDAGIYRVVAMNSAGEASTACFLNVEPVPELTPPPAPEPPAVAPRFSLLLADNHVTEGNPVTLRATVTGQPKPTIAWFREGMPLIPDNELQIHESSDGSVSATIHAATLDHTGQYEIVASNTAGTAKCVAYLSIEPRLPTPPPAEQTEPPVFTKLITDVTVTSGCSAKFEAEVMGLPTPTVHWTLNDCRITGQEYLRGHMQYVMGSSRNTHTLELPTTSMMQAGRVAIIAENSVGKAVSAATLEVIEPVALEVQPIMPVHQTTREETFVTSNTSSSSTYQQSTIIESSHFTQVVSSDGTADEKKHSMAATSTSQVKKATGQPTVEVHGARLQEMRQEGGAPPSVTDKVSLVKREGEIVTQQVSQDSSTILISPPAKKIVIAKKKSTPARFLTPLQGVITKEGEQIVLECIIDGFPDPVVTWTHNGGPVSHEAQVTANLNKATLIIPRVKQSHSGHYTCAIENETGSAQCTCDVIVKKTQFPPVISKRLQPAVVGVNERLHLEIDVTGTPLPQVTWSKDGQPLSANDHITLRSEGTRHLLIIQQAEPGDSGRYGVIASNPAGRAESLADVMVTQLILDKAPPSHRIMFTDISDEAKMFTSRSEEVHEERRGSDGPKTTKPTPPPHQEKKPKYEEYRKETKGKPGTSGPFSEDTYYAMKDESDVSTDKSRTQKKVEFKSETHVEVMSDKKVEVFESTSVDVTPQPPKKQTVKVEPKLDRKAIKEPKIEKVQQVSKPVKQQKEAAKPASQDTTVGKVKTAVKVVEHDTQKVKTVVLTKSTDKQKTEEKVIKKMTPVSEPKFKAVQKPQHDKSLKESFITSQAKVPKIEPLKSTGLVKQAVTKQEREKEELDLKPFPFKVDPEKPKMPRGAPPRQPSKFVKVEFHESDYESDYEGRIPPKWKPSDSDVEDQSYGKIKPPPSTLKVPQPHVRTPTPPTAFDEPPKFEGPPRPKVDFPESETEPEREISPEIIIPENVEIISRPEPPRIVPKEPKIYKSQPQKKEPPPKRPPSPILKPGSPPIEDYVPPPQTQSAPYSNAIGVESTKITKIADSGKHHQRFVTMQQTTRVIKFTDSRTASSTETHDVKTSESRSRPLHKEESKLKPLPPLEPFPFSPETEKAKKDRGAPPPKPKKFQKGEFTESDYESDYERRIKPKWQPTDSDAEDLSYTTVKPQLRSDRTPSKTRERTPTPPTVFDTPPGSGGPWRPVIEPSQIIVQKEQSLEVVIPKELPKKIEPPKKFTAKVIPKKLMEPRERSVSPPLPSPGSPPEEGIIVQETQYVVDKVDLKSRVITPPVREIQTYEEKPYTKVIERTEKTFTNLKLEEELRMKKERMETKKTVVTEYEHVPKRPPPPAESEQEIVQIEIYPDLEPFPFEPDKDKPRKERGPPPPKPKKFVKGEFRESDYDSDYESRVRPKWKPPDSDAEDPEYTPVRPPPPTERQPSRSKERTPTPPSKFEVPPSLGGPLRPTIDSVDAPVLVVKEPSPEIIIPKVKELPPSKILKVTPKAPVLKPKEPEPQVYETPSPPLPEPGPQPEIGYVQMKVTPAEEKEDVHIKMIRKKIEAKKGFQIDIDITDIYDFVSESDHEKVDIEASQTKPFPQLQPFPYEPDPSRPKRQRGPPPPQPKKFMKGEFRGSDYESDYEKPIAPKWVPPDSEGEEHVYRRVAPPIGEIMKQRSESLGRDPSPPSKFDQPPQFEGPPRPVMELSDLPRRERRESLEEYSIPRFPKVEFKPFDLEEDAIVQAQGVITTDTETEPESHTKDGLDRRYVKSAQKTVSNQFDDMTQTFRHKAQKFAEQLVTEVFAAREGSVPAEPAGEPPSLPEELRTHSVSPDSTAVPPTSTALSPTTQEPQAYRDESRVSEFGTKHIDPDTGLIYFKYDFGYEFGVILPGEAKKVEKKKQVNGEHSSDIPIPVIHEKTDGFKKTEKSFTKTNGHVHHMETTGPQDSPAASVEESASTKGTSVQAPTMDHLSPHPSLQSDISETDREYQQYMGKMIPEFVPKKQAQFRPISGDPYSDSEAESDHPSPSKIAESSPGVPVGPRRFVPLVPGAAVQPKPLSFQGSPTDALYTSTELGVLGSPLSATPPSTPSTPRSGPLTQPTRPPHYITPLRDLTVVAGEALRLECVVQADPPVQVTWSKGGIILQNGPDYQIVYRNGVCRLIIPQVFPEDEGVFTSTAVNLLGMDSTSATVCITGEKK